MGQALYRKYRSTSLAEVVGQQHITTTLANALKNGAVSHAYLFTGPRGVGKTSVARIFAHEVNGLPYDVSNNHLDIIEIDAASNRRIDEIREIRERVGNAPASAKYKVYIIDEVHMLTREAFNALLKTLEEPPDHAIFILATTEAHKLPETIVSRTQRFSFKPLELNDAIKHLKFIAEQEKIAIDDEALELIAEHGNGSMRDSISLLDQAAANGTKITAITIKHLLGQAPDETVEELIKSVQAGDLKNLSQTLLRLTEQGIQPGLLAKQLGSRLRRDLIHRQLALTDSDAANLLQLLIEVPASHDPQSALELALFKLAVKQKPVTDPTFNESPPAQNHNNQAEPPAMTKNPKSESKTTKKAKANAKTNRPDANKPLDGAGWQDVLEAIKTKYNTLYSLVRMGKPTFEDSLVTLEFTFPFHQKRLSDAKNQQIVIKIIEEITGRRVELRCILANKAEPSVEKPEIKPAVGPPLDSISSIFGGAEVIE